jgi:hypothetical protein
MHVNKELAFEDVTKRNAFIGVSIHDLMTVHGAAATPRACPFLSRQDRFVILLNVGFSWDRGPLAQVLLDRCLSRGEPSHDAGIWILERCHGLCIDRHGVEP